MQSLHIETVVFVNQQHAADEDQNNFWKVQERDVLSPRQQAANVSRPEIYAVASISQDLYSSAIFLDPLEKRTGSIANTGKFE